ncbi:MAG: ArsR/SmtB family transcription factor [Nitrosopumilaceae archaeon]
MDDDSIKPSEDTQKIEIFSTDHEKIKLFGELLTNDSSRKMLQILFEEELTANEISQKTGISLQLVKYHINKMEELGVIKVSKTGKNSKSHDMKYYKAKKFAVVILPSKVSEIAKESKSLNKSFKTIYKFVGIGVAAVASLFSLSFLQQPSVPTPSTGIDGGGYMGNVGTGGESGANTLEETLELARRKIEAGEANPATGSGTPYLSTDSFLEIMIIIAIVGAAVSFYWYWRAYKHSKKQKALSNKFQ